MEPALRSLLIDKNKVKEATVKYMADNGCITMATFANWVDQRSELEEKLHKLTPSKGDLADLSNLKQAWRESDASITRGIKRNSEGLDSEALDDPLQQEVFKAIATTFRTTYNWPDNFDSRRIGCDSLHGRFRREFERKQPSMYTFTKAKSLSKSQREGQVKKTKLSDGMALIQTVDQSHGDGPLSLGKWFSCFDIVVNTWAVVGCFDVTFETKVRKYVHWAEVSAYMYEFQAKANELQQKQYADKAIFYYLSAVEEEMRSKAIEMARSESEVPWGECLKLSTKANAHLWQEKRDMLEVRKQYQQPPNFGAPAVAAYVAPPNKGASTCRHFNKGTCSVPKCGYAHVCSQILVKGNICGRKDHGAHEHDEAKHGAKGFGKGPKGKGKGKGKKK
jgi:hypothetical protein